MKYGSIYNTDNRENNYSHRTSGTGRSPSDEASSPSYSSDQTLRTDGLLRSSSQERKRTADSYKTFSGTSSNRGTSGRGNSNRNFSTTGTTNRNRSGSDTSNRNTSDKGTSGYSEYQNSSDTSPRKKRISNRSSVSYRTGRTSHAETAPYQKVSGNSSDHRGKKKLPTDEPPKKKRGCLFPILLLVIIIAVVAFFAFRFSLKGAFSKIKKYPLDKTSITVNDTDANINDYQNIALFGVDSQDNKIKDTGSRTDCIIIASINKSSHKVKLMSIYRDTYVSIDGEYDKINAAYSYGGPELALRTINRNLDLNITDFATVNFKALADAVDVLGGIPLTINSEKELKNLNDYIGNMNHINGGNSPKFDKVGTYTFDGNQAVAYSRIRYMEGGDHARANHQRLVLEGIMNAAKKQPLKLGKLISTVLPQCKTSLSNDDLTKLTLSMARSSITDSQAYPFKSEDERYGGIYYGFPITAKSNVVKAHEYLFGTKNYEPTEELQKISAKIKIVADDLGITE